MEGVKNLVIPTKVGLSAWEDLFMTELFACMSVCLFTESSCDKDCRSTDGFENFKGKRVDIQ